MRMKLSFQGVWKSVSPCEDSTRNEGSVSIWRHRIEDRLHQPCDREYEFAGAQNWIKWSRTQDGATKVIIREDETQFSGDVEVGE